MKINDKIDKIRGRVFHFYSRLLERQLYRYVFEDLYQKSIVSALIAYQNKDGGFGNGIEPDLNIPDSTGIGMETALFYFYCIDFIPDRTAQEIIKWLGKNINNQGFLDYPPSLIERYPHQPWRKNSDDPRILAVVADLLQLKIKVPETLLNKVDQYAESFILPDDPMEYDYPIYTYAYFRKDLKRRDEILSDFKKKFPILNEKRKENYLLLGRYWNCLAGLLDNDFIDREAHRFWDSIDDKGLMTDIFPHLPWWRSIFTLDGIILLKKMGYFE